MLSDKLLDSINYEDSQLHIAADNGEIYSYQFVLDSNGNLDIWEQFDARPAEHKQIKPETIFLGSKITVQWEDRRPLSQILAGAKESEIHLLNAQLTFNDFFRIMVKQQ